MRKPDPRFLTDSERAVRDTYLRLGIAHDCFRDALIEAMRNGCTTVDAARACGISEAAMRHKLVRYGISARELAGAWHPDRQ